MSERVTLARGAQGALVAHKTGLGPEDAARLRHEGELLRAARHPGVVALLGQEPDCLVLAWVGGHTLATTPQPSLDRAVALTITVATTLADLHQIGLAHGAVDASHILIDESGRPVLCSFSQATQAPSPADAEHRERADADVMALGEILGQLVREVGPTGPHRVLRHRFRTVARLAERAASDPPARRLSARAFAAALADAVPGARTIQRSPAPAPVTPAPALGVPVPPESHEPTVADPPHALAYLDHLRPVDDPAAARPRRLAPARVVVTVSLGLAVVVGAVAVDVNERHEVPVGQAAAPPPTRRLATTTASPVDPTTLPTSEENTSLPPARCAGSEVDHPEAGLDAATGFHDTDGDGCREPVLVDGNTITVGDRRWTVGNRDDVVAVADWDCDGTATPALLRPTSGHVFVFASWAPPSGTVDATATTLVPSAVSIGPDRAPCPGLVVTRADGSRLSLPTSTNSTETVP